MTLFHEGSVLAGPYPLGSLRGDLFDALLGPAWRALRRFRALELTLELPPELQGHSWEAMRADGIPLLAISRRLGVRGFREPVRDVPKVLFASGAELTDPVIRPGAMFLGTLRDCDAQGLAQTRVAEAVTLRRLSDRCASFSPDVVHLVAHGRLDADGGLWIGLGGEFVPADRLAPALTSGARPPLAVVLSICHSAVTAGPVEALLRAGVPVVVAMGGEITEYACRLFSRRCVDALLHGESVAVAVAHGRQAASAAGSDWALPALYVTDDLPEDFQAVDLAEVRRISGLAGRLELLEAPAYVGRTAIFDALDEVLAPGSERTLLGITSGGPFENIGGTRLLREIGLRLFQSGHVPLLLAPFDNERAAPHSLRQVVAEILIHAIRAGERLGLPVTEMRCLDPVDLADPVRARQALKSGVERFAAAGEVLSPGQIDSLLAADLADLAAAAQSLGPPFGEHTRVAVLAEALHLWVDALGWTERDKGLLDLLTPAGLGTPGRPAPVIVTAELSACYPLRNFREEKSGMPWCAFLELEPFSDEEAALGFQWVLLQEWHPDQAYRRTYYAPPGRDPDELKESFRRLMKGRPGLIKTDLYRMVHALAALQVFHSHNDSEAWHAYARLHGLRYEP
ncbi:CHAT domain-containing protein [Herbidospora cretacea]|uniref:CHAT domain-containing protein n=1 Tax=Herbidospora cretacea TaxID=28444 RepID=UPI00147118CB|nr:CHAT domain-containing protein [Herbidospora cretacea]